MTHSLRLAALLPLAAFVATLATPVATESVAPNDNRRPAGTLKNGVLEVKLEARAGAWHPEGETGRALDVAAFAEEGKPLSTPGPLIRVPVGTEIRASVRNSLDKPITVFGFGKTRGMSDSVIVAPSATATVGFKAAAPGTYYYAARRELDPIGNRAPQDQQLVGAIVVDAPNAKPANDRVMVLTWFAGFDPTSKTGLARGATMAINGLSWPHTERLDYAQGDSVNWRVINMTEVDHPMHLHGFYFRVTSHGNGVTDTVYTTAQQRMAVTEIVDPFTTLSLSWRADRAGNWIYHCHYALHLSTLVALDRDQNSETLDDGMMSHHMTSDAPHQMFGLVMGIRVASRGPAVQLAEAPRKIRMEVREKANVYGDQPGFSFVLDKTTPQSMPVPAPALFLERGRPVAITVVNTSSDHAAVHWHGIELESYPDGVPGWSGSGASILPAIKPRDSITVRFTPPRPGSFMYHSHFSEAKQMGGGAYGPIIVLEPGQRFDPETDKVLFFGTAGVTKNVIMGPFTPWVLNGEKQPADMNLKAGTRYRFRLFNLAGDAPTLVSLTAGDKPVQWRAVAKDGYPLPPNQATSQPAALRFDPGEIYDFEFTPAGAGELVLNFGPPQYPPGAPPLPPGFSLPPPTIKVPVHVR